MPYVLGIDGGNSKTLAVLATDEGHILGAGRSGNGNHQGVGLSSAMEQIVVAVQGAFRAAGIPPRMASAAFFALAGADLPEDFEMLVPALQQLELAECIRLDNDSIAGLWSGTESPNAVVVVWGAGTNAAGRNAAGQQIRLPALGDISGDWGGGGSLASEAIRLVARAHDGRGAATMLTDLVLEALDLPDPDEMIRALYFNRVSSSQIHGLARLVFIAANAGDAVARELVDRAALEVATTARALLRRLDLINTPADLVLSGSVFKAPGPLFLETIRAYVQSMAPEAHIVLPNVEPVVGSLFGAIDLLGLPVDAGVRDRARKSYTPAVMSELEEQPA